MQTFDQVTGVTERMIEQDGKLTIVRSQNVQALINQNKIEADLMPRMFGEPAWRKVASIPATIIEQWSKECGCAAGTKEFDEYMNRKLLDGDNAAFLIKGF